MFAHSLPGQPPSLWEMLADHSARVSERAALLADAFGASALARAAGSLHDIGKTSAAFQRYIGAVGAPDAPARGPDHSTAGAREACDLYGPMWGKALAYLIAGHHAGLADGPELERRLDKTYAIESYAGWRDHAGLLPGKAELAIPGLRPAPHKGFSEAFLIRMLFSCLVDADFLETEGFYDRAAGQKTGRGATADLAPLAERLRMSMQERMAGAPRSEVNRIRAEVLDHVRAKAQLSPGLFTLTVPTGGGKTLASLSFALEHALLHGLRRIVYVIPFTSIIEQTAAVFRAALGDEDNILEHHASFDWDAAMRGAPDNEGADGLAKLRKAAENWDVSIVVTTAVQFYESLYAHRTSRCRKLHNLARSVIILDEAQTMPIPLLRPCVAALDELQRNYRASIVLCTATQPALRKIDGFEEGFDIDDTRELAPDPVALHRALKRVAIEVLPDPVTDETLAARLRDANQILCIVNSRAHARQLYEAIADAPGATHLSTLMCPRHRRTVLESIRTRLKDSAPVRLVSTSLIEAGVDVDFPEVWRAIAGIENITRGSVDRNLQLYTREYLTARRSPRGSVDRNLGWPSEVEIKSSRSPRGSVDRNSISARMAAAIRCRSPRGSVDRNNGASIEPAPFRASLPTRERGSKHASGSSPGGFGGVAPHAGAWIETYRWAKS